MKNHNAPLMTLASILITQFFTIFSKAGLEFEKQELTKEAKLSDTSLKYQFPFKVTGDKPVTIKGIQPYCACVQGQTADKKTTYNAGEAGVMEVTFELSNFSGKVEKQLGLLLEGSTEEILLKPTAVIPAAFTMEPMNLKWEQGGKLEAQKMTLTSQITEPLKIRQIVTSRPDISQEIKVLEAGKKYEIWLTPKSLDQVMLSTALIETTLPYPMHAKQTATVGVLPKRDK